MVDLYILRYLGIMICFYIAVGNRTRMFEQRRENNTNDSFV